MMSEAQKRYKKSEKGKAAERRYNKSEARKVTSRKYSQSEKGKITSCKATKKYQQKEKGKVTQSRYKKSQKGQEALRKHRYGISPEEYNTLVIQHEGKCRICRRLDDVLCIDHNHKTDKIRGLLCHKCNTILGMAGDNIEVLSNAIKYLEEN